MAGTKGKINVKTKISVNKDKKGPVRPKMGKGTGGILPVSLKLKVEKDKKSKKPNG